jgi:iron-sulfur cluster assembly protein
MTESIITLTESAARHVHRVLTEREWPGYGLRFGLQDGGCSGYTYLLEFEAKPDEEDLIHEEHGVRVFIHPLHVPFVQGTVLDYKEDKFESRFDVQNPNAKRYCGCGESFDV